MLGLGLVTVLLLVGVGLAAAAAVGAVLVSRGRDKANRVVPEVPTNAPASWAGTHTPQARLHRRLRDAVVAARAVADPDGALIAARVEVEHAAVAVDEHLVALAAMSERERASRMPQAAAAVASVEQAAARLADARGVGAAGGALPAVEHALERARLVAEARAELEADPAAILFDAGAMPAPSVRPVESPEGTDALAAEALASDALASEAEERDGGDTAQASPS